VIAVGVATIAALAIAGTVTYTPCADAERCIRVCQSFPNGFRYALQRTLSTVQDGRVGGSRLSDHSTRSLFSRAFCPRPAPSSIPISSSLTQLLSDSPTQLTRFRDLDRLARRARVDRLNIVVGQIRDGTFVMAAGAGVPRVRPKRLMDSFRGADRRHAVRTRMRDWQNACGHR